MSHSNGQNPTWKPDDRDEDLFGELRLQRGIMLLAIALDVASRHKLSSGEFDCPWCLTGRVRFSVSPSNGHGRVICSTDGCVKVMQ